MSQDPFFKIGFWSQSVHTHAHAHKNKTTKDINLTEQTWIEGIEIMQFLHDRITPKR